MLNANNNNNRINNNTAGNNETSDDGFKDFIEPKGSFNVVRNDIHISAWLYLSCSKVIFCDLQNRDL